MEIISFVLNVILVVASIIVLYFAYARKSELGKLSVYVIFASLLLQEFLGYLGQVSFFDFTDSIISTVSTFVIYGEIILLVILLITRLNEKMNRNFRVSLLLIVIIKLVLVLGLL